LMRTMVADELEGETRAGSRGRGTGININTFARLLAVKGLLVPHVRCVPRQRPSRPTYLDPDKR